MSVKTVSACVPVGTIFYTHWGYDQTNIDFYEVVRSTAKTVWVTPIYSRRDSEQKLLPRPGAFIAPLKPEAHRVRFDGDGRASIKIESWGLYGWEYDQKPLSDTWTYGGTGH